MHWVFCLGFDICKRVFMCDLENWINESVNKFIEIARYWIDQLIKIDYFNEIVDGIFMFFEQIYCNFVDGSISIQYTFLRLPVSMEPINRGAIIIFRIFILSLFLFLFWI